MPAISLRSLAVALLVVALPANLAEAPLLEARIVSGGDATIVGDIDATVVLLAATGKNATIVDATILHWRYVRSLVSENRTTLPGNVSVPLAEDEKETIRISGSIQVRGKTRWYPQQVRIASQFQATALSFESLTDSNFEQAHGPDGRSLEPPRAGTRLHGAKTLPRMAGGAFAVVDTGTIVLSDGRTLEAGLVPVLPVSPGPVAGRTTDIVDRYYAVIETAGQPASTDELELYVSRLDAAVRGRLAFTEYTAEGEINGTGWSSEGALLAFDGSADVTASWQGRTSEWIVRARPTSIVEDAETTYYVLGGGAAVVALALAFPRAIAWLAGALFSRHRDPIAHPRRREILDLITAEPGLTEADLVRRTGIKRTPMTFHLGVLRRNHLVDTERSAKQVHFLPNSGRFAFNLVLNGRQVSAAEAIAALRHPLRRALLLELLDERWSTVSLLQTRLGNRPGQPLIIHHLKVLERKGLIGRQAGQGKNLYRSWLSKADAARLELCT